MELLQHNDLIQFLSFIPKIKKEIHEWRMVSISLPSESPGSIFYVAKKLHEALHDKEGQTFICNNRDLLALVKSGANTDMVAMQHIILRKFPDYPCAIEIVEASSDGLQKIELRFKQTDKGSASSAFVPLQARQQRQKNTILIADDDTFMRSLAKKTLQPHGEVIALEDGTAVVDTYLQILPDILYLDIHMPGVSGIDILREILTFDREAYVIMLSADSAKDNVLNTKKIGAKGFVTKPFTKEKLEDVLWKCPTIRKQE